MKIKEGFLLKEVAGSHVVISVGKVDFDGMITLNDSAVLLWKKLCNGATEEELVSLLLEEYDVSEDLARRDVTAFLATLSDADLIEHDK